ncbi:MAG: LptF/LptG family permease [Chitinophagaceae bacterium]
MKILDWYILKRFLVTFLFTILTLTIIAVVIDTSEKTDDFVKSGLSTSQVITQYYFGFVPFIISMIFPLIVFIAVIFFTSKMAARSEIVAILANGVNFNRMLRPYLIGGVLLGGVLWLSNQYLIPKANEIRSDFQLNVIDRNSSYQAGMNNNSFYYLRVDPTTFVGIRYYDTSSQAASGFFLQKIRNNKVYYNLRSESIRWDTARSNWKVENAIERKVNGLHEEIRQIPSMHVNLNVKPSELRKDEYLKDKLITPELRQFIRMEELRGAEGLNTLKVERYRRDATPVAVIILTIIGVAVASPKTRGGSGLPLAFGIVTASLFVVMDKFSTVFSTKGNLHPLLAAWLPNIIFGCLALYMYRRAPK